jgi:hypothetical protein
MTPPLEFALAIALPVAAVYAVIGGGRLLSWISEHQAQAPAPEPIQRVRANLVRLRAELEATENRNDLVAKNMRLRAVRAAYADALREACWRMGIAPLPGARHRPENLRQSDIYRLETALRERGIDVRETAASLRTGHRRSHARRRPRPLRRLARRLPCPSRRPRPRA